MGIGSQGLLVKGVSSELYSEGGKNTVSGGGIVEVLPNMLGWWLLKVGGANPRGSYGNESSEMCDWYD